MIDISVFDDLHEMTKSLNSIQRKQLPFAISRALNDTIFDARKSVVRRVQSVYDNKKKWYNAGSPTGIKAITSRKTRLFVELHAGAYFAERQEEGGVKRAVSGKYVAIPVKGAVARKFQRSDGITRLKRAQKGVFITTPKGNKTPSVFKRVGKKRKVKRLFSFAPKTTTRSSFRFYETAKKVADRRFTRHFSMRLDQALRTAK